MIDLRLAPYEEMIRETARSFAHERLLPALRAHEAAGGVEAAVVRAYRGLGFATMEAPEAGGGQGLPPLAKMVVLEELGAGDAGAALALEGAGSALRALVELGEDRLLARVTDEPDLRVALVDDTGGRLKIGPTTVTGEHAWTPAPRGTSAVVVLQDERMALVSGVRFTPVKPCGLEAAGSCRLDFDDARIVTQMADAGAVERARAHARLFFAALLVGVARAASEYAMRYAQERVAFGRPIAHHQGIAFLLTDMATGIEAARLAVWRGAVALGEEAPAGREAAWALAEAAEQALFVGPSAVQVLGGHGFMKDYPVEKWMRDIRTLAQCAGGRDQAELAAAAYEVAS